MGFFGVPFPFNPSIAGDGPMPREDIPATRFRQFWLEAVPPAFLGVAPQLVKTSMGTSHRSKWMIGGKPHDLGNLHMKKSEVFMNIYENP